MIGVGNDGRRRRRGRRFYGMKRKTSFGMSLQVLPDRPMPHDAT